MTPRFCKSGKFLGWRGIAVATALVLAVPVVLTTGTAQAQRSAAAPNAVLTWHRHAETAIFDGARQGPTASTRSFAIVQGAVYDAVNAIAGSPYEPYLGAPASRPGDSTPAAVAAAAYRTLLWLFPGQADSLLAQYNASLAAIPDGAAKRGGVAVGEAAAAAMIDARTGDGGLTSEPWPVGTAPGQWRPTPPGFIETGAWVATLKPFAVRAPADYRTPGPPALTSATYARELNEVKALGSPASTARTADQTDSAKWWDDPRMVEWTIVRQLATNHRLGTLQTARLLAMVNVTAIDTLIACYDEKKLWSFWRPVTAVPLADTDGNRATEADPSWTPLRTTAPSPEYPSGHTCFTSATMAALRKFFGRDNVSFSAFSPDSGTTRRYSSFSAAMVDLIGARIWAGVHYRSAGVDGDRLAAEVAPDVLNNAFGRR